MRSSIRPVGEAGAERREGGEDLVADLEAAGPDPGADRRRGRRRSPRRRRRRCPRRARASRRAASPRRRRRRARSAGSRRRRRAPARPGAVDHVPVDLAADPARARPRAPAPAGPSWTGDLGAVDLPADHDPSGSSAERRAEPAAVRDAPISPVVAGQDAEVEALERALADAAEAGRERGDGAGQLGLEPADSVAARASPSPKTISDRQPARDLERRPRAPPRGRRRARRRACARGRRRARRRPPARARSRPRAGPRRRSRAATPAPLAHVAARPTTAGRRGDEQYAPDRRPRASATASDGRAGPGGRELASAARARCPRSGGEQDRRGAAIDVAAPERVHPRSRPTAASSSGAPAGAAGPPIRRAGRSRPRPVGLGGEPGELGVAAVGGDEAEVGVAEQRRASPARARGRAGRSSAPPGSPGSGRRRTSPGWSTRSVPAARSAAPPNGSSDPVRGRERDRDRVDGEVAAGEVLADRRRGDSGSAPGCGVGLGPGPGEVGMAPVAEVDHAPCRSGRGASPAARAARGPARGRRRPRCRGRRRDRGPRRAPGRPRRRSTRRGRRGRRRRARGGAARSRR